MRKRKVNKKQKKRQIYHGPGFILERRQQKPVRPYPVQGSAVGWGTVEPGPRDPTLTPDHRAESHAPRSKACSAAVFTPCQVGEYLFSNEQRAAVRSITAIQTQQDHPKKVIITSLPSCHVVLIVPRHSQMSLHWMESL